MNAQQIVARSPLSLLGLLGLTLFASPVAAQVFDNVISVPQDVVEIVSSRRDPASVGGDGLTTQLNVSDGGSVGEYFEANSGSEVNISGGTVGAFFTPNSGSEVNISGGSVGDAFEPHSGSVVNISGGSIGVDFDAKSGSVVNISAGSIGDGFTALPGSEINISGGSFGIVFSAAPSSEINLFGYDFFLDGEPLEQSLLLVEALTIVDRDVTLSGRLGDGSAFSFDLNSAGDFEEGLDGFDPDATLTVTLVPPVGVLLGDVNNSGGMDFLDIGPFIEILMLGSSANPNFLVEAADINVDGEVNFLDVAPFIELFGFEVGG